jgi:hypothetical protein
VPVAAEEYAPRLWGISVKPRRTQPVPARLAENAVESED